MQKLISKIWENRVTRRGITLSLALLFSLAFAESALAACPANPDTATNTGTTTSAVIDKTTAVAFTTIDFTVTTPASTCVAVKVRTGNVAVPDGTWTAYSALMTSSGSSIAAYSGRYIQYMAVLGSDNINNAPSLNSVTINQVVYNSPATLGGVAAGNVGLRLDAGAGQKAKGTTLTWTGTTASAGQKILFKVRAGDTQAELDTNQCYGPTTLDSGCADWTTAGKFFSQINGSSNSATTIPTAMSSKRYIEVLVRMESSGVNTPVLNDVSLTYDTLESPSNSNLTLTKADATALKTSAGAAASAGVPDAWSNTTTVRLTAAGLTCTSCSVSPTNLRPEVEIKATGTAFDGATGLYAATAGNTYVDISNLTSGTGYHIQVRAIDDQGRVSGWTSYGSNAESAADITIEQTVPTGTVSVNAGANYATSTSATLTNAASDTGGSNLSQMQFSNDGTSWSGWETYNATKAWTLASGDGAKTVYAQFRDNAGNQSGTWTQTSQADFDTGSTKSNATTNTNGTFNLASQPTTSTLSIAASVDDAGGMDWGIGSYTSSYFDLSNDGAGAQNFAYLRFQLNIPKGSTISSAALKMTSTLTNSGSGDSVQLFNSDNMPNFTTPLGVYGYGDVVNWTLPDVVQGTEYSSPNMANLIQTYISRAGYNPGNYVGLAVYAWSYQSYQFASWDNATYAEPKLQVTYTGISGAPYTTSGNLVSSAKDNTTAKNYGKLYWAADVPSGAGADALRFQVAANNDNATWNFIGPDGTAGTYFTTSGTQLPSSINGNRYIKYKAYLQTADTAYTPTVYDVSIEVNNTISDGITLDATLPTGTLTVGSGNPTYVATNAVTLYLDATDSGSGMQDFQLSNDGSTWGTTTNSSGVVTDSGAWKAWSSSYNTGQSGYSWYLTTGDGSKTVYVKYRDNAGNVNARTNPPTNYIAGRAGSALVGKYVYNRDVATTDKYTNGNALGRVDPLWKTTNTTCTSPQCTTAGPVAETQSGYTGTNGLVADNNVNFNPSAGATPDYPARDACKALGGRLPTIAELVEMYSQPSTYGNNFQPFYYWSSTEGGSTSAYITLGSGTNIAAYTKNSTGFHTRCVSDNGISSISDAITLDGGAPTTSGAITAGTVGSNGWYNSDVTYTITPADAGSGVASTVYCTDTAGTCTPSTSYTTALTISTESATNHVRFTSTDNVGNVQTVQDSGVVKIDKSVPTTTGAITAGTTGSNGWYTTNVTYTLTLADNGSSGVASTVYCADTAGSCTPSTAYTTALTISTESAINHIRWKSTDNAGLAQTVQDSGVIKIDKSLPTASSVASVTSNPNNSGNQNITWSTFFDGTGSGFASYTLQRKMVTPTAGSYVDVVPAFTDVATLSYADNSNLAQGTYIYRVVVRDNAGNSTASGDSTTVIVDKTAPIGTISINEGLSTKESTIHLTLATTDTGGANLASYDLSNTNDGSDWQTTAIADSPASYGVGSVAWTLTSGEGAKTIYVRYKDNAGTYSETYSDTIYNDTTPPTDVAGLKAYNDSGKSQDITANNTTTWYPYASAYFQWDASSAGSGISTYKYCFGTSATCTPTISTSGATNYTTTLDSSLDGTYYLRLVAVSNVLLESTTINTFQYNFDKSVPAAVTGFTTATPVSPDTQVKLTWNAVPTNGGAPLANYRIERVESASYPGLTADWSSLAGYAIYTTTNLNFTDDASAAQQGQPVIQSSIRYHYRISAKDQSNPDYGNYQASPLYSYTRDIQAPETPPIITLGQAAFACTTGTCPATDPLDASAITKGFATKLTWTAAADAGSGVAGYKIYRTADESDVSWQVVGVLYTPTGLENTIWYDNDTHNDATYGTDKTVASTRLNDSTRYYYRITAVDAATPSNETSLFPQGGDLGFIDGDQNRTSALTPDVTAPTVPVNVVVNPQGLDSTNEHQLINIQWGASLDYKARNEDVVSGTVTYHLYRSTSPDGPWNNLVTTTADLAYNDEGLADVITYYYRVSAYDAIPNESGLSALDESSQAVTYSSEVPGVPASTSVTTTKGDPSTDTSVGHTASITFTGSMSKTYQVVRYEVYRSLTNTTGSCNQGEDTATCWIRVNAANKVQTLEITPTPDDRGDEHTITDVGLTDSTMYYYRVRAQDNNPAPGDQGNKYSGLTTIAAGTIHAGWDITPDVTAPDQPTGLKVKDIHDDGMNFKRNIITWARIVTPTRLGTNDFMEYRIYRSDDGLTWSEICQDGVSTTLLPACTVQNPNPLYNADKELALANNYFMDLIPISEANQFYYYYVTAVDDASKIFTYASPNNSNIINNFSNESKPAIDSQGNISTVSLNPAIAQPSILTNGSGLKATLVDVGVSSAVISWTTDQPADTIVEFRKHGTSDPYIGVVDRSMVINHQITAKPLDPNTTYDYRLISRNSLANDAIAEGTDLPTLTTTGFTITPGTVVTTTSTAEINWVTNLDSSSSFVEYQLQRQPGDDPQGGTSGVDPDALAASPRSHSVIIKGLRSNRTYTYKIKSISKDGYLAENPIGSFSSFVTRNFDSAQFTLDPASSNVADRNITSTTAQIVWQTATETTSWVDYGTAPGVYGISSGNDILTMTHVITIEGLIPGTKYYYHVRVKDSNELEFTSQEYSFTAVIKPKISNMQVKNVTPYSVTIAWDTNVETETVLNWGKTAAYTEKHGTGGTSQVHQVTIDNLEDNTEYHYQIVAHDAVGNEVVGTDQIIRTPLDTEGPKISAVKLDVLPMGENDTTSSIIVSWQTNKPASTLVEYDEGVIGGSYKKSSIEDNSFNTSHTVIIKDLTPASSYHYRLVSRDKRANTTISQDYTFVTPSREKSILQLILKALEETFAWTKNLNQFFGNIMKRLTGR